MDHDTIDTREGGGTSIKNVYRPATGMGIL